MTERLRLGLVFGGRSVEHEVSVVSAQHVIAAADPSRFEVVPIGVSKEGGWLSTAETLKQMAVPQAPFQKRLKTDSETNVASGLASLQGLDAVFPLIHGAQGEDGALQGALELLGLPYVGCGVGASAVGMDKALMKAVFKGAGIAMGDYIVLPAPASQAEAVDAARELEAQIDYPAFVKPANGGSSLGISKVRGREELTSALLEAGLHDRKLVIEKMIEGREVECGVLGNRGAEASPVGEIRFQRDFYDYEAKYLDPATRIIAPAELPPEAVTRVQELAVRAFEAIDGSGMSRVDFFYCLDGTILIDEINTIPGFTPASMFPRLWQVAGLSYSDLISRLVDLALARHREKRIA